LVLPLFGQTFATKADFQAGSYTFGSDQPREAAGRNQKFMLRDFISSVFGDKEIPSSWKPQKNSAIQVGKDNEVIHSSSDYSV
jgi:hypothetical protein